MRIKTIFTSLVVSLVKPDSILLILYTFCIFCAFYTLPIITAATCLFSALIASFFIPTVDFVEMTSNYLILKIIPFANKNPLLIDYIAYEARRSNPIPLIVLLEEGGLSLSKDEFKEILNAYPHILDNLARAANMDIACGLDELAHSGA